MDNLLRNAGVSASSFYRWEKGKIKSLHPVTLQKIVNALEAIETEAENAS